MLPSEPQELRYLVADDGHMPFQAWFDRLHPQAAAKATIALVRLGGGAVSAVKSVGEGVFEYRIDWGPGYRVYFGRDGARCVVLLTGGTKRRQSRDIARARALWAGYRRDAE